MAGGLFAISRKFFFELGLYDEGLDIWGGENFELSYKIWMCHGQMLFVPCSRVGHVYRMKGWRGNGTPSYVKGNFVDRNYVRVVEVWWDEYAKYFYERKPAAKHIDPGDLTAQKAIREKLQCKSFDWFMKEIGYDLPKFFPLKEPENVAYGHITNHGTNLCVDGKHGGQGKPKPNSRTDQPLPFFLFQVTNFRCQIVALNRKVNGCSPGMKIFVQSIMVKKLKMPEKNAGMELVSVIISVSGNVILKVAISCSNIFLTNIKYFMCHPMVVPLLMRFVLVSNLSV